MSKQGKLYAIGALFNKPKAILNAAAAVRDKKYIKFDVNTPYALHGMDDAMGLKPTNIGIVAFIFGVLGLLTALIVTGWTSVVSYPLVIGGKPLFSFPAFVPIIFELTVLFSAVGAVAIMFMFYHKFPFTSHPIHDSKYMQKTSSDHFGIYIESDDPNFAEENIRKLYKELNAVEIVEIFYDQEEVDFSLPALDKKFIGAMVALFIGVSFATWLHLEVGLNSLPFNWMVIQNKYSAQAESHLFANGSAMRDPVEGTVARGYMPYLYAKDPDKAGKFLINPLSPNEMVLLNGQEKYDIFCSMCHGDYGEGDGRLKGKFPVPPSLHSRKVREDWTDGRIYHVITAGQNSMPSYAKQIPSDDRWAIIHYLRVLQRSQNAKESDLQ